MHVSIGVGVARVCRLFDDASNARVSVAQYKDGYQINGEKVKQRKISNALRTWPILVADLFANIVAVLVFLATAAALLLCLIREIEIVINDAGARNKQLNGRQT